MEIESSATENECEAQAHKSKKQSTMSLFSDDRYIDGIIMIIEKIFEHNTLYY